jgi:hypothetical protein
MAATPIFGPYDVTRSTNFADNQLINLRPEIGDGKDGKGLGALYGTPGLDLLAAVGVGPVNGLHSISNVLYVVSNLTVYTVTTQFVSFTAGVIVGSGGRVSMIDNGTQIAIFTDLAGYVGPAGFPITGGAVSAGGINYSSGDTIVLQSLAGGQTAACIIRVTGVSGGAVSTFTITQTGAFNPKPTTLVQQNTTGSGSGFQLGTLTFGGSQALCQVALPFTPSAGQAMSAVFQDGFALINQPGTMTIWQSQVLDISVWPALNFATADGESDTVQALKSIHREIFVVKTRSTEVWNNAGAAGFAFQPLGAVMIERGTPAWGSVAKVGESLMYLSETSQGVGIVVEIEGFAPRRVSNHAIETLLATAIMTDAFAYSYTQEGHQLYVLTLPTGNFTLVYDKTDSMLAGVPVWYQWLSFANGLFSRHPGNVFSFFNQFLIIGDYASGHLYQLDLNTLTDAGAARKWVRTWRATARPSMMPQRFTSLQVDFQTGIGIAVGANPQVVLRFSDDGGHNWSSERYASVGRLGQTSWRVRWTRLGSTRRNSGLDRIFELSSTDQFPVAIVNAELDV